MSEDKSQLPKNKFDLPWSRIFATFIVNIIATMGIQMMFPFPYGLVLGFLALFGIPLISVKGMESKRKESYVIIIILSIVSSAIISSIILG